jgi:hypothetical protein
MKVKISNCRGLVTLLVFIVLIAPVSCNRSGSRGNEAATNKLSTFERDFALVRRNNFRQVYVISRLDGGALNADDKTYLKMNMPIETTMRILTDADRRLIVGTNYELKPEHLAAINERFKLEDFTGR